MEKIPMTQKKQQQQPQGATHTASIVSGPSVSFVRSSRHLDSTPVTTTNVESEVEDIEFAPSSFKNNEMTISSDTVPTAQDKRSLRSSLPHNRPSQQANDDLHARTAKTDFMSQTSSNDPSVHSESAGSVTEQKSLPPSNESTTTSSAAMTTTSSAVQDPSDTPAASTAAPQPALQQDVAGGVSQFQFAVAMQNSSFTNTSAQHTVPSVPLDSTMQAMLMSMQQSMTTSMQQSLMAFMQQSMQQAIHQSMVEGLGAIKSLVRDELSEFRNEMQGDQSNLRRSVQELRVEQNNRFQDFRTEHVQILADHDDSVSARMQVIAEEHTRLIQKGLDQFFSAMPASVRRERDSSQLDVPSLAVCPPADTSQWPSSEERESNMVPSRNPLSSFHRGLRNQRLKSTAPSVHNKTTDPHFTSCTESRRVSHHSTLLQTAGADCLSSPIINDTSLHHSPSPRRVEESTIPYPVPADQTLRWLMDSLVPLYRVDSESFLQSATSYDKVVSMHIRVSHRFSGTDLIGIGPNVDIVTLVNSVVLVGGQNNIPYSVMYGYLSGGPLFSTEIDQELRAAAMTAVTRAATTHKLVPLHFCTAPFHDMAVSLQILQALIFYLMDMYRLPVDNQLISNQIGLLRLTTKDLSGVDALFKEYGALYHQLTVHGRAAQEVTTVMEQAIIAGAKQLEGETLADTLLRSFMSYCDDYKQLPTEDQFEHMMRVVKAIKTNYRHKLLGSTTSTTKFNQVSTNVTKDTSQTISKLLSDNMELYVNNAFAKYSEARNTTTSIATQNSSDTDSQDSHFDDSDTYSDYFDSSSDEEDRPCNADLTPTLTAPVESVPVDHLHPRQRTDNTHSTQAPLGPLIHHHHESGQ